MLLLALDTSTRQSSVALCTEDELIGEYTWSTSGNHSVELLEHIQRLLAGSHGTLAQLDALAVATGPGSFNGVRVALATAKSLAFALKKPLLGVGTLDCIAAQARWQGPVCAILEAGRSEIYAACYSSLPNYTASRQLRWRVQRVSDYRVESPEAFAALLQEQGQSWFAVPDGQPQAPFLFCGEISAQTQAALSTSLAERCIFGSPLQSARRSSVLATLAFERLQSGEQDDPLQLEPFYLRRPSITKSTRKQPLLGGTAQTTSGQNQTEREEGALRH